MQMNQIILAALLRSTDPFHAPLKKGTLRSMDTPNRLYLVLNKAGDFFDLIMCSAKASAAKNKYQSILFS